MADYVVYHIGANQKRLLLAAMEHVLERHERVAFACLYGSLLERPDVRDIDVGIYLRPSDAAPPEGTWPLEAGLAEELEAASRQVTSQRIPVDVRVMNDAPLAAQFAVLTGEVILVTDREAFARIVENIVPRYLDLKPLRERTLREVLRS